MHLPETARTTGTGLALAAAGLSGALVAVQQRLNGALGQTLGSALLAALVSFAVGLVCVAAAVLVRPAARRAWRQVHRVPLWQRLGGLAGATLVAVGAAATPRIGVALLTVGLVAGQTGGGLLVDRLGLAPGGRRPVTAERAAGAALCLAAVAVGVLGRGAGTVDPVLLPLVVLAGLLVAAQQAVNGRVRATTGNAAVATLVNFAVGTAALVAAILLAAVVGPPPAPDWPGAQDAHLYLGGVLGAGFVAMAAVVVRVLGVLRLGLAVVAGQLLGAVLIDLLAPVDGAGLRATTVVGALLTLVAVAVSGRGPRRTASQAPEPAGAAA